MSNDSTTSRRDKNRWLFLLYLCDDFDHVESEFFESAKALQEQENKIDTLLEHVLQVENMDRLAYPIDVVYQFDSFQEIKVGDFTPPPGTSRKELENLPDHHCVRRHLRWCESDTDEEESWDVVRHAHFKTIDTGKTQTLKEFFEWAQQPIADASGIVVVFAGLGVGDKKPIVGKIHQDYGQIFSICDDNSSFDALNPIEVQDALEMLVNDYRDGEPIDALGFDMSSMQFVEVAFQFMGLARTMIASQNNGFDPSWPYADLIWQTAQLVNRKQDNGRYIGPPEIGSTFVQTIGHALSKSNRLQARVSTDSKPIVSALDLSQLDVLSRSMDTLFLNLLQELGDPAIWQARDLTFLELRRTYQDNVQCPENEPVPSLIAYDLKHMLLFLRKHLVKIRDAKGVLEQWLEAELRELYDPLTTDQLTDRKGCNQQPLVRKANGKKKIRDQIKAFIDEQLKGDESQPIESNQQKPGLPSRLWRQLSLIAFDNQLEAYCPPLDEYEARGEFDAENPYYLNKEKYRFQCSNPDGHAFLNQLKERFDRLSWDQLIQSASTATHLLQTTQDVVTLLEPPSKQKGDLSGFRTVVDQQSSKERAGCIVAQYVYKEKYFDSENSNNLDDRLTHCGLSIYRPEHLDRLAECQYLDFSFHQRVHWVSLMAAVNLIRKHPGQLWKVVSSLISTCTGAGRDELLQRLAGPTSVVNRFGKQFQALQNPLTFTLTVTENRDAKKDSAAGDGSSGNLTNPQFDDAITYKLKLETNRQDAFVDVGRSTLNPRRAKESLKRLESIIAPKSGNMLSSVESLEDFARDLGEDIFQGIDLHIRRGESNLVPHLQLQLPIELMGLPWEVMNEGRLTSDGQPSRMLCQRFAISRQALVDSGMATSPRSRTSSKIRVLIIGDPKLSDSIQREFGAVDEARDVEQLFRQLSRDLPGTLELAEDDIQINTRITGHDLRKLIRSNKYDIIHFAGHAIHNEENPDRSGWLLSDGILWAQEISNTLKNCQSPPWLVYANACESGMSSIQHGKQRTNVYGLGTAFTNNGVTAYLGPLWEIEDFVAGQLATDFYRCLLLDRATIGESLYIAKRNAQQRLD